MSALTNLNPGALLILEQLISAVDQPGGTEDGWGAGVVLCVGATLCGALGKALLRLAHFTSSAPRSGALYALALLLLIVADPALSVTALNAAMPAVVAACAGLVVLWTALVAPLPLQRDR